MSRVLVTGGGGFLGGRIVERLLERGDGVRVLGRSPRPGLEARGIEVVRADLADEAAVMAACAGCRAVFHVAAKAGVWGPRADYWRANVQGTRHILAGCRHHRVPVLVHTSTPSVVFSGEAFRGADESLPYGERHLCAYSETKAIAEREVLAANEHGRLTVAALRPHLIWGPGDPHLLPRVIARARAGRLRIVGDGRNRVDITHVDNAAHAHLCALDALEAGRGGGRAYFISQGEPVALWGWLNEVLVLAGLKPLERHVSYRKALAAGAVCEALWRALPLPGEPPMTRFVATELAKDHWFDTTAAREALGYVPLVQTRAGTVALRPWLRRLISGPELQA